MVHKSRIVRRLISLLMYASLCLVFLSARGWAQESTGTIGGTVTDSGGAVVPQAAITITNEQTNLETHSVSNESGAFEVPQLEAGTFEVKITKQGFETYRETHIVVKSAQVATINAVMKVGSVTTIVEVQASSARVETTTPELSSEVTGTQMSTLPLNGRNYQELSFLMPGVTNLNPDTAANSGGFLTSNLMSTNGTGVNGTLFYLDGIYNMNSGSMDKTAIVPNPDTIEEARLLQNNFSSQYTLYNANAMILVTKSGTSTFHGTAFEYFRNDALNARNFFTPKVPAYKQNIFGFNIGGPITIPGHFNTNRTKVFFFLSTQWTRQIIASNLTGPSATAAQRNGTFSTKITNPVTGQPFPKDANGNYQIPANMLNAQSLIFYNAVAPLPNNPAGGFNNYLLSVPTHNNTRDDEGKLDINLSSKLRLMVEYLDSRQTNLSATQTFGLSTIFPTTYQPITAPDQLAQIRLTQIISSSLVNTTSINMCNYNVNLGIGGLVYKNQLPSFSETNPFNGFLSNKLPEVDMAQGWPNIGVSSSLPDPHSANLEDTLSDDASWLRGNHYIQFGFQQVFGTDRQNSFAATAGKWLFNGQFTGNPMADFLLGDAATFTQASSDSRSYQHWVLFSPYIQDQWKVRRRLTLTAGFRFLYSPLPSFQNGIPNFIPSRYNPANAPTVNLNGTFTPGPTYDPINGIVFGGITPGYPANYSNTHNNFYNPTFGFAVDVFGDGKTSLRGGFGITHGLVFTNSCDTQCPLNYPLTQTLIVVTPPFPNATGGKAASPTVPTLKMQDTNLNTPMITNFSLSLQHEFKGGWFFSIAGASDFYEHGDLNVNANQPLPGGGFDFNPIINTGTVSNFSQNARWPGYGSLVDDMSPSHGHWEALELNVRHPVGHNLFLSVAYTWQGNMTNSRGNYNTSTEGGAGTQNVYNINAEYGPANDNPRQVFSLSTIWTLPWFAQATGLKRAALGGWQFSDVTSLQSGFPLDPSLKTAHPGLATLPNRVSGTSTQGPKTVAEWFNTSAFVAPPAGFFGNAGVGSITGPGSITFNAALYKDFRMGERQKFQIRAELFNAFNHTNFSTVSTGLGTANFGHVTAALDPRIAEIVLRYEF